MCIDARPARQQVVAAVNDDFASPFLNMDTGFAQFMTKICDAVTFFIAKVFYILEARRSVAPSRHCTH